MMKEFNELETLMKTLPKEMDFSKENEIHQLIYRILSKAVVDVSLGKELKPIEIMSLSKELKDLMSSIKDREKIKAELRKEIQEETLNKVEIIAKNEGMSKETIEAIRKALEG